MRHIAKFFLFSSVSIFVSGCAYFSQQKIENIENQTDKIAVEAKSSLTRELAKAFAFFKNSGNKIDKIMYRTRDDIDAIIYDAQKQYYEQDQN